MDLLHQRRKERQGENTNWATSLPNKRWCENRSSTSSAIGVVLHRRQKLYFIVKGSSTAPKGTKTVFSFRHPKPPLKLCFRLGNLKNVSRAQYIYNEREEKFHFILKKVVAMLVKRPEPMYLCNRKQGGTLLKRVPLGFAPRKGRVLWKIYIDRECSTREKYRKRKSEPSPSLPYCNKVQRW